MSDDDWIARADRSLHSAVSLRDSDPDAACSRAYYAMFYAARAALIHAGQPQIAFAKTHSQIISAFSQYLVKPGAIPAQQGRDFAKVAQERLIADYSADGTSSESAAGAIDRAGAFIGAVRLLLTDTDA